jgi:signal transduction histidine kinase
MTPLDWAVDVILMFGVFGFSLLQLTLSAALFIPDDFTRRILGIQTVTPSALGVFVSALLCAPLIVRRRFPWPVYIATLAIWCVCEIYFGLASLSLVAVLLSAFTLAYERSRNESLAAAAIGFGFIVAIPNFIPHTSLNSLMLVQNCAIMLAAVLAGYALHARQEILNAAEARAIEAEHAREADAMRAAQEQAAQIELSKRRLEQERVEIAREVHDITAHSLSAVNIQATAAARLIDSNPEAAKNAVENIRVTSKRALEEMRAIIAVLRSTEADNYNAQVANGEGATVFTSEGAGGDNPPTFTTKTQEGQTRGAAPQASSASSDFTRSNDSQRTPVAGTSDLGQLAAYLESAGIEARIDTHGYDSSKIPAYIDIALFKIAREAVTNIARHSHATKAEILLWDEPAQTMLEVTDNGTSIHVDDPALKLGHGIKGMRERARALGGTFELQSSPMGGLRIMVSIPHPRAGAGS